MLTQAVAIINGKGGVGKTASAAALAGMLARPDRRVLTVDLDPQANLGRDLGYADRIGDTGGRSLLGTLHGYPLEPLRDVRPGLDCVTGGDATDDLLDVLRSRETRQPGSSLTALAQALGPLATGYALVILDCPPGNPLIQRAALATSQYLLIPTRADDASIDGLLKVDALVAAVRSVNPNLHLLGAYLFAVSTQARRLAAEARTAVADCLGGAEHILETEIRHAEGAARDCRRIGALPHELEQLRASGGRHRAEDGTETRIAASSVGLAADYQALAQEVIGRIRAHRTAAAGVA